MLIHPMAERLRGLGLTAMADAFLDMRNQSAADDLSRGLARSADRPRADGARQQAARPTAQPCPRIYSPGR
jgi:hypothetical protein